VVDKSEELGGYTVSFVTFREDLDQTPMLKGAPDDRCQCGHWGYVTKGRLVFQVGDGEETSRRATTSTCRRATSA